MAAAIIWMLGLFGTLHFNLKSPSLEIAIFTFGVFGFVVAYYIAKWMGGRGAKTRAKAESEYKTHMNRERDRLLEEAKASGKLDQWD